MSDEDKKDGDLPPLSIKMVLEAPPAPESPMAGLRSSSIVGLFGDDSIAMTAAKLSVNEAILNLLTKDYAFSDFVRELLLTIMKVVKCEAGSILEVDHAKGVLFFRAVAGQSSDRVASFVIPIGQGIVGHVAESRLPLVVSNVSENKLHLKAIQDAVGFEAHNLVALPIVVRGKVFGVLELLNRIGESDFLPTDIELLTYLCEMSAKAVEIRMMIAWTRHREKKDAA